MNKLLLQLGVWVQSAVDRKFLVRNTEKIFGLLRENRMTNKITKFENGALAVATSGGSQMWHFSHFFDNTNKNY
jgi:hypothetical protein